MEKDGCDHRRPGEGIDVADLRKWRGLLLGLRAASRASPKHAQLSGAIREAVEHGLLGPGDKLPTELELVELTPFSLGTVQRAIRSLVDAGIVRRQPRLGTFVLAPRKPVARPWHCWFVGEDGESALPVFQRVLGRGKTSERGAWSEFLLCDETIRLDRLIDVNDEFLVYSRFFVDAAAFPALLEVPLERLQEENFRLMLDREFGAQVRAVRHKVCVHPIERRLAEEIRVGPGSACMSVDVFAYRATGKPLYYQELTVPPTRRKLLLTDVAFEQQ